MSTSYIAARQELSTGNFKIHRIIFIAAFFDEMLYKMAKQRAIAVNLVRSITHSNDLNAPIAARRLRPPLAQKRRSGNGHAAEK
jgi:hypothetical protein